MTDAQADRASEWDAHWPKVSAWMQTNPAYKYRQKLIWRALGLPAAPVPACVLDIGCGDGSFLRSVNAFRSDIAIAGLEGSGEGLELARRALPGAVLEQVDLQSLPPTAVDRLRNFATHALCSEVIEHVDRPIDVLAAARPLLAPTGVLVVTVPAAPCRRLIAMSVIASITPATCSEPRPRQPAGKSRRSGVPARPFTRSIA